MTLIAESNSTATYANLITQLGVTVSEKTCNDHAAQMGVWRLLNFTNIIRLAPDASIALERMIVHSFIYPTRDGQDNGIFIK